MGVPTELRADMAEYSARRLFNMTISLCSCFTHMDIAGSQKGNRNVLSSQKRCFRGTWLAQSVEQVTLDLWVMSSSPTRGEEMTSKKSDIKDTLQKIDVSGFAYLGFSTDGGPQLSGLPVLLVHVINSKMCSRLISGQIKNSK